jgi:hypothetical protein
MLICIPAYLWVAVKPYMANELPRSVFNIASAEYKRNARFIALMQNFSSISTTTYLDSTFGPRLAHFIFDSNKVDE